MRRLSVVGLIVLNAALTPSLTSAAVTSAHFTAEDLSGLPRQIRQDDLIAGLSGSIEAGGFHPATPPADASDLTDGAPGNEVEAVLADSPQARARNGFFALQIRYDFREPKDVQCVRVFAENVNNGVPNDRPGQSYQIEYSEAGDPDYRRLEITNSQTADIVSTGPYGGGFGSSFSFATVTEVWDDTGRPIMSHVDSIRFVFYPVSNTAGAYWDPYFSSDPKDVDGHFAAFESGVVKEIDVIEPTQTLGE